MIPENVPGASYLGDGRVSFLVWAPWTERVEVRILDEGAPWTARGATPGDHTAGRLVPLAPAGRGYHGAVVDGVEPGARYVFRLDGNREFPDPASRFQPEGVHGPSEVVARPEERPRRWPGVSLHDYVIYELHIGTFSEEGTFDGAVRHLDAVRDLGVTALEIMPVAQFPGSRNWGYDGAYPFAVQDSYGGPEGLRRLVDAAHERGLAVVLDVVYNHLGPEGAYLREFGPYFTERYRTPWGDAINFDGPWSDEVRRYFVSNALYWLREFGIDALRLDAIQGIFEASARPFLMELGEEVEELSRRLDRRLYVIAESDLNDTRVVTAREAGGLGLDAQWSDDFHHSLHTLLTGSRAGYYRDFGSVRHLARALTDGFVYSGQHSAHRNRRHGISSRHVPAHRFVVCAQNHDQVGNQIHGARLCHIVGWNETKLAAGVLLLSPYVPLLFMGEEYADTARFPYFVSHSDPELVELVRRGRSEEFAQFDWDAEPADPQAEETFLAAKLHHALREEGRHRVLRELYRELLRLRREVPALARLSKEDLEVVYDEHEGLVFVRRWSDRDEAVAWFHFGDAAAMSRVPFPGGPWRQALDSEDERWEGSGSSLPELLDPARDPTITVKRRSFALYLSVGADRGPA